MCSRSARRRAQLCKCETGVTWPSETRRGLAVWCLLEANLRAGPRSHKRVWRIADVGRHAATSAQKSTSVRYLARTCTFSDHVAARRSMPLTDQSGARRRQHFEARTRRAVRGNRASGKLGKKGVNSRRSQRQARLCKQRRVTQHQSAKSGQRLVSAHKSSLVPTQFSMSSILE
jgi:hypothetical protein